jgi:hypothetical protein
MELSEDIIITSAVSVTLTLLAGFIAFRVKIEQRLKDLETDLEILEPLKIILLRKGSEHVDKVFEENK